VLVCVTVLVWGDSFWTEKIAKDVLGFVFNKRNAVTGVGFVPSRNFAFAKVRFSQCGLEQTSSESSW
jgi:hypothetical protein